MTYRTYLCVLIAAILTMTAGCESKQKRDAQPEAESADEADANGPSAQAGEKADEQDAAAEDKESAAADKAVEAPEGWTILDPTQMSEAQRGRLDEAKSAQKMLGGTLMKELTTASAAEGFPAAVKVCNVRAPEIADKVHTDTNVAIGRTSFKLRNPKNTPPQWAEPFVEARVAEPTVLHNQADDKLAYLAPIKLGEMCANCHGPKDKLAPGVKEELAELYPEDEATGFEPGDLRGWFWVEVPKS